MTKTQPRKKLSLPRETVRALQTRELHLPRGGVFSDDTSCYPVLCFPDSDPCP